MEPLITVVTVCYNSAATIGKTMESVLEQDSSEYEYLIIDGGSADGTTEIIESYQGAFRGKLRWISERDRGWYDAMNKGIRIAKGSFINFLNSDDYFEEDALNAVAEFIRSNNIGEDEIVYGDSTNVYHNSHGKVCHRLIHAPDRITISDKALQHGMCGIRHQSMFTGRKVFAHIGNLDLQYRLHADWDFLVKCVAQEIPMKHIHRNLSYYSMYGVSTKPNYRERHFLRKNNSLYRGMDLNYLGDRWGIKVMLKRLLGDRKWNDLLFRIHEMRAR